MRLGEDDFMADVAAPLWSHTGRSDLAVMRRLGANAVRMYGNNPNSSHAEFLDEASWLGLQVIPGLSDYPYLQMPGNCVDTDYNCFQQVKEAYRANLENGFAVRNADGTNVSYHTALLHVIVMNEPDNKLGQGLEVPRNAAKAMVSAIDGMLEAEIEFGFRDSDQMVNFTVPLIFARCPACSHPSIDANGGLAIDFMLELHGAFHDPEAYGYSPRNDLAAFYQRRWINSFNTHNKAETIVDEFMSRYKYVPEFAATPCMIEEYHAPNEVPPGEQYSDLSDMRTAVEEDHMVIGFSFFEFQKRYDKEDPPDPAAPKEDTYGMFGLGSYMITNVYIAGVPFPVWCLDPVEDGDQLLAQEVATAFAAVGDVSFEDLCVPKPLTVPANATGYDLIYDLRSVDLMATFIRRVITHLGGSAIWDGQLRDLAAYYTDDPTSPFQGRVNNFSNLVLELWDRRERRDELQHKWIEWAENPACVASMHSNSGTIGYEVNQICSSNTTGHLCDNIPWHCTYSVWNQANYLFSASYSLVLGPALPSCYFQGAAWFVGENFWTPDWEGCIVTTQGETTAISEEGWAAVRRTDDTDEVVPFLKRLIESMEVNYTSEDSVRDYATSAVRVEHLDDLKDELFWEDWICGGVTFRYCMPPEDGSIGTWFEKFAEENQWMVLPLTLIFSLSCAACGLACIWVRLTPDTSEEWFQKQRVGTLGSQWVEDDAYSSNGEDYSSD